MTIVEHLEAAYSLTVDPRSLWPGTQERRDWLDVQVKLEHLRNKVKRMTEAQS